MVAFRVFVYRPGAIGDTVLTLPALAALPVRYPGCHITYAGNAAMLPLLPVDQALSADDPRLLPMFAEPARPWGEFDLEISFSRVPFGLQRNPLEASARGVHMADWLVDAVDPTFSDRQPRLSVAPAAGVSLVIHPGAGGPTKRWAADGFAAVANAFDGRVAIVSGPADGEATERVLAELRRPVDVWTGLTLSELAGRLAGSDVFLGNDSGITHLAAAIGLPAIALYTATDPAVWGIRGPHTRRLAGSDISVDSVLAAVMEVRQPK